MQGKKEFIPKLFYRVHLNDLAPQNNYARWMSSVRSSTVEPVLGTWINFLNMKRVSMRGIDLDNKHWLCDFGNGTCRIMLNRCKKYYLISF
jgi:hypothetical protein